MIEQGLLGIFGLPHFAHAEINGVEQCGATFGDGVDELALDIFDRLGEVGDFFRLVGEGDHEEFVLRIRRLEELDDGFAGALDLAAHAAAHVEDHTQRDGSIFTREVSDLLLIFAFEYREIFLVESGDQAIHGIGNGDRHQDQIHAGLQWLGMSPQGRIDDLLFGGWRRLDARIHMHVIHRNGTLSHGSRICGNYRNQDQENERR